MKMFLCCAAVLMVLAPAPGASQDGGAPSDLALGVSQVKDGDLENAVITLDTFIRRAQAGGS